MPPGRNRDAWIFRVYPGGTARMAPAPARIVPAGARWTIPANGAVATGNAPATAGSSAVALAMLRAARYDETGPCQSSCTLRHALPVIVGSGGPTKSTIA